LRKTLDSFRILNYDEIVPTINDVALECGVSITTVSTVLNNASRPVKAETRQRVLAAARRLNYHPNAMATALVRRRVNTIGVLPGVFRATDVLTDIYAFGVLQGILQAAAENDFHVTLFTKPWQDGAHSAGAYRDRRTDGIIIVAPTLESDVATALSSLGLLVVTIAAGPSPGVASVDIDNYAGARLAVEHLFELGHQRIAHITGIPDAASVCERQLAFIDVCTEHGFIVPDDYIISANYSGKGVAKATRMLLSLPSRPTAIFAGNDAIGKYIVDTAVELGLRVPADLSVVGFDDSIYATTMTPQLTTIRQSPKNVGALAASLLIARVNGEDIQERRHLLPPELVVRNTTSYLKG
jgi:LacI family transcriptional regulator